MLRTLSLMFVLMQCISAGCPPGYLYTLAQNACFKVVKEEVTHDQAIQGCNKDGARLVTINDQYENSVIRGLAQELGAPHVWIGLIYLKATDKWEWMDEMPLGYNYWADQTPIDEENHPHAYMNLDCCVAGSWANGPVNMVRGGYVCRADYH